MAQITLDSSALDELNSVETRTLFDTADKLSSSGVGRIVNLPQIIVVGDQSSGKSSVLEAISHVHFPVQGGVCTRFATELVLRPGSLRCVTASVQFADSTRPTHSLQVSDFNQEDIDSIIGSAKDEMGLTDTGRSFSKDVLRLEIQDPDMYPLTLVDLQGIFHTETAEQSAEGMATVMELVESYMRKPNSIILAIISANNQLADQAVLQEAAKHDPSKARTLGVITKPDLLSPGSSSEHEYLQIVRGRDAVQNLGLGWHVLRNRADYEGDLGPRDTVEEQFFKSQAWGSIPSSNRGVGALRVKLSRILHDHVRKSLPAVIQDIQDRLSGLQFVLDRLGQPRSTQEDMKAYLIDIASHFQRLVQDGIRGHYIDPFFSGFNGSQRKLRSNLRNFNRAIREILVTYGSAQRMIDDGSEDEQRHLSTPAYLREFLDVYTNNKALPIPEPITRTELSAQLERQAASNQGTELPGYLNMETVIQLFQKQVKPWKRIAALHNEEIIKITRIFVDETFEHIVGSSTSNSMTDAILNTIVTSFFVDKEQRLSTKLEELFRPFEKGFARPLDADFQEAMEKSLTKRATEATESGDSVAEVQVRSAILSQSKNEFGTESMIHAMQTFYDMALRTFTDNLINLGIESCLIQDLPNIFTPRLVNDMKIEQLHELAAESEEVRHYRSQLQGEIKLLKQGLEQCRRYRPRETARGEPNAYANTDG
ncbi:dynamin family protein [Diaporthe helianthi]|uniref:Dynamin family protein n=1 Tax=Diaporthe helianthi TaxID=158607 RepID=A0A2P5HH09_DIAHE|nr:dynamin family protein [Diaporthe helianthi]